MQHPNCDASSLLPCDRCTACLHTLLRFRLISKKQYKAEITKRQKNQK